MEPDDAHSVASSSLSSLTPSPARHDSSSPLRKRPRLSSASPPPPTLPPNTSPRELPAAAPTSTHAFDDLLDGLGDDDFRMLPSSDPAASGHRPAPPPAAGNDPGEATSATMTADDADLSAAEGAADDSGLGLLADVERDKGGGSRRRSADLDDADAEDNEFEGDDMWLELDGVAVGFDQPDTFPSSALSLAPLRHDDHPTHDARPQPPPPPPHHAEPRLSDFGFASVDPAMSLTGGGLFFATRKPFVISNQALQRARAIMAAADAEPEPNMATASSRAGPPARTSTPLARPGSAAPVASTSSPIPAPRPVPPPAFAGFQSGAGRAFQMPSEEALERTKARFDRPDTPGQAPAKRERNPLRPLARATEPSSDVFEGSPAPARARPPSRPASAFALAPPAPRPEGAALAPPSSLLVDGAEGCDSPTTRRSKASSAASGASRDGSRPGSPRRAPLQPVNGPAADVFGEGDEGHDDQGSSTTLHSSSPPPTRAATPPRPAAAALAPPAPTAPALAALIPVRPPAPTRPVTFRPPMLASTSTPSRPTSSTPLRPFAQPASTPFRSSTSTPAPVFPPQNKRLNLGMTPRNKPFHLANTQGAAASPAGAGARGASTGVKAFVSPFRGGQRPPGLTAMGLKDKAGAPASSSSRGKAAAVKAGSSTVKAPASAASTSAADVARRDRVKVFELDAVSVERHPLGNFGMHPQMHFYEAAEAVGVPKEVLDMSSTSGLSYTFSRGRGVSDAFAALQAVVASRVPDEKDLVTLTWVKNHWKLILWKVASYVRSRPDLLGDWWTFERVVEQLRYRYEREINRAERSAIKRIQERDSPASLPMVLCVSQVRWGDPPDEADNGSLVIVGLELTDGWYRIRTNVDATLKRACERGKLVVGSKIAVSGAKLDSVTTDGVEVLQGLHSSTLVISGNSTSLAPWHATLGFRREPFVAGLSSLSPGGGLVPLVDVVIDRAFACGFIDLRRGRGTETWGEDEERVRAEEWKRGRKRIEAKLSDEAESGVTSEDQLVELLRDAASALEPVGVDSGPSPYPDVEPDEVLDRLEGATASARRSMVHRLSAAQVPAVLELAIERARESRHRSVEDLQKELADKYPPRDIRCFRMVRVGDARETTKQPGRSALLTVWDADKFGDGFFDVGTRYLISNLVPKGSWRPQDREVSLATRRDSRWRKL
ncbi:hypothetical protein JCM3775_001455 [Rhodotorula graminis]